MLNYQVFLIHICLVAFPLLCNKQQYVLTRKTLEQGGNLYVYAIVSSAMELLTLLGKRTQIRTLAPIGVY